MSTRNLFIALLVCVIGGLAVGGVATAVFRTAGTPSAAPDIAPRGGDRAVVAHFAHATGATDRVVVLQHTPDGYLCVWDAPDVSGNKGVGGCNPAANPLGGRKLFVSLAYEGGPSAASVREARLSGLVATDVATAEVVMTDGSSRRVVIAPAPTNARALSGADYRAFAYRVRESDLRGGLTPVAVLARNAEGAVVDRQTTGIG